MDYTAVLFLGFVCTALGKTDATLLTSPKRVEAINALNVGWTATEYEQFAQMELADAQNMLGCLGAWPEDAPPQLVIDDIAGQIPPSFDARTRWPGSILPIRDQGNMCGSCWAFSTTGALSDRFAISTGNRINVSLSAQQLVDCDRSNHGCDGGWPYNAFLYMNKTGDLTVDCYGPYTQRFGQCKFNSTITRRCPSGSSAPLRLYRALDAYRVMPAVEAIQTEIMTRGPVVVSFRVYEDFFDYRGGVYRFTSGRIMGQHAVKMLGWGRMGGTDYWICANSWGTGWGLKGYFYIRRGFNECGIEDEVVAGIARV